MRMNKLIGLCLSICAFVLFFENVNAESIKICDRNNPVASIELNENQEFTEIKSASKRGNMCGVVLKDQHGMTKDISFSYDGYCSTERLSVGCPEENMCYLYSCQIEESAPAYNLNTITCGDVTDIPEGLPKFTSNLLKFIMAIVPVVVVILGIIDFVKASALSDDKLSKQAISNFLQRLIAAIMIFLAIVLVKFVINLIDNVYIEVGEENNSSAAACINCFVNGDCD